MTSTFPQFWRQKPIQYERIGTSDSEYHLDIEPASVIRDRQDPNPREWCKHRFSYALNLALLLFLSFKYVLDRQQTSIMDVQHLYSPAQDMIKHQIIRFNDGFASNNDSTIYQGTPSPELDAAWNDLYSFGLSRIPTSQAQQLVNETSQIPNDEGYYVIQLDVFHQLHCLNMIRKALAPSYYSANMPGQDGEDELFGITHIDHCVDAIRQSLMCNSDISTQVFQWKDGRVRPRAGILHTCRDFGQIKEWAMANQVKGPIDWSIRVESV